METLPICADAGRGETRENDANTARAHRQLRVRRPHKTAFTAADGAQRYTRGTGAAATR